MSQDHSRPSIDQPRRRSVFCESGLFEDASTPEILQSHLYGSPSCEPVSPVSSPVPSARLNAVSESDENAEELDIPELHEETMDHEDDASHFLVDANALRPSQTSSITNRLAALSVFLALAIPLLQCVPILSDSCILLPGVKGGVIRSGLEKKAELVEGSSLAGRADYDPTNYCKRWSQQSALINGTLYLYGGRSTTSAQQSTDEWNNDFLTIDMTNTWQISSPSMTALPQPSGPPPVANGYLWNSYGSVFLYGGEFSDTPVQTPTAFSLWEYNLFTKQWYEHSDPTTSAGDNAEGDGQSVQSSAEGAGFSVPALGRGWYFGGHQDYLTTQGWSDQVARIYLKSLIEYTFPGFSNSAVQSLTNGKTAGSDGTWRNVTQGGLQEAAGFTERADGILVYIPGFGKEGILLGLAGGTNSTFTQMNVIDVYDIASSTWYKQATSGSTPGIRVNPCAVVAAADDGSSYQVHMFGGQNLLPYGSQTQYNDMWILTVPSFTWIEVDMSNQAVPYARSGHTCNIWDGQMVMVGGYIGTDIGCESPGVYVFNTSALAWQNQFTSLTGQSNGAKGSSKSPAITQNRLSQQPGQIGTNSSSGLQGSYGYLVPEPVLKVIGGDPTGGATVTAPAQTPTDGPLATGKPITYTVTGPGGSTITETATPGSPGSGSSSNQKSGPNIGAIVAGVVAGLAFLAACYFAFCAWVYRRQVALYRDHVALAQRAAADPHRAEKESFVLPPSLGRTSGKNSSDQSRGTQPSSSNTQGGSGGDGSGIRRWSQGSSTEDLLAGQEPTFWGTRGVLLNPTRSLRVINRD